ncbi:MAG: hypothetical protein A2017_19660 [Lentisphaerae bacterium GWF2_44_16]|nr:MAG: hypothetical protein A2017_19660 [Lentisphaerae bacterium GWF2_44_16]
MNEITEQYKEKYFKPINEQIADYLRNEILEGKIRPDERMLPVNQLAERYGVSLVTMQKAMVKLTEEGLIVRFPGKGTFVAPVNFKAEAGTMGIFMSALGENIQISPLTSPSHYEILTGIEKYCHDNEFSLKILHKGIRKFDAWSLNSLHISGMIVVTPQESAYNILSEIKASGIPTVSINLHAPEMREKYYCVNADFYNAGKEAVNYLYGKGKRKIAFASCYTMSPDIHPWHIMEGYKAETGKFSLKQRSFIYHEDLRYSPGKSDAALSEIVDFNAVDSIITTNQYEAAAIVKLAETRGLRIPEDISLIGFFDTKETTENNITTFRIPQSEMGYKSAEKLHRVVEGKKCEKCSFVKPKLIIRKTA